MNILDLKRQLWALLGVRNEESSDNHSAEGSAGLGGLGFNGRSESYSDPSLAAMTNMPTSGLNATDRETVAAVREAVDNGTLSRADLDRALSGHSSSAAGIISFIGAALLGRFGTLGANAINSALKSSDPMSAMRGLADKAKNGGSNSSVNGDFRGSDGAQSSSTDNSSSSSGSQAPSVVDALAGTLSLSSPGSGWGDYVKNTLPGLQNQVTQATDRGNAAYDTAQTNAGTSVGLANQMNQDYTNIYRPFGKKMADEVNSLNSDSYLAQQRGKAVADVQQQSDAAMGQQQRNLQRMGVNPSSGRALAMGNQNAIATAAAKASAAGKSDAYNKQNYLQGLSSMNNFGSTLQTQARANNSQAMDWSKYGLASGITGLGANMDLSKLTTSTANTYGGLANNTQQVANGATQTSNQQSQYDSSNDLGNLAKSALVGTAIKGLGRYVFGSPATSTASKDVPWYMQ